jgi:hypothetical protein
MLGIERADVYYDARSDPDHNVSLFRTSGSLAVSWKRVNQVVGEYLAGWHPAQPLFLYVSYGDTHFPYDHRELDDLLGVERLPRRLIRPENPEGVFDTYANAAANVDRAIEALVALLRARIGSGELAVIVTSDHGEALFEDGVLGHGLALDVTQTRVPMVVSGLGGEWPEPLGISDVRTGIQRSLAAPPDGAAARLRFARDPGRRILQYMAVPERPRLLSLRGVDTVLRYDTTRTPLEGDAAFDRLIWWWEAVQLGAAAQGPGG